MDYKEFLHKFHPISDKDYELLFSEIRPVSFKKGQFLAEEGHIEKDLFFIYKGVQMTCFNNKDKEHIVSFSYPFSLCGVPDSFLYQIPSEYNIRALTDSECGALSFHKMNELFEKSQQIERLFRKMIEAKLCGLIVRHREFHSLTIEERFKSFAKRSPHLFNLVPHKYIASYLNIEPTNFSKLYNSIPI